MILLFEQVNVGALRGGLLSSDLKLIEKMNHYSQAVG